MTDTLPEVAVADAPTHIRAIYERMMVCTGTGTPALIFRHFAVTPGLLEWVWQAIGPDMESGHAAAHTFAAVATVPRVALPAIGTDDMVRCGLDADAQALVRVMVASYNRMNPINLSLIAAIRALIADPDASAAQSTSLPPLPADQPPQPEKIPAPVNLADMSPKLQAAVLKLSAAIPSPGVQVIPTLYRHLAIWPAFMLHLTPGIYDAIARGEVKTRMDELLRAMQPLIANVTANARARGLPPPPVEDRAALVTTLESFLFTIPQLIVIGGALAAALPLPILRDSLSASSG